MPFINGRYYMNPAYGRALEAAREAEEKAGARHTASSSGPAEGGEEDVHWITKDHRHIPIHDSPGQGKKRQEVNRISIPPEVRAAILASVKASNSPSKEAGDKYGGFHEEGGIWGRDAAGNVIVIAAKAGQYADPRTEGAEIDPTVPANPGQNARLVTLDGEWHVHPSGTDSTVAGSPVTFRQDPNGNDFPNAAKFPVNIVVGAGDGQVYVYTSTKVIGHVSLGKFHKGK